MNYSHAIDIIRNATGPDGWLDIDPSKPPTEKEKTSLALVFNRKLLEEFKVNVSRAVKFYFDTKEFDYHVGLPVEALQIVYQELFGCLLEYGILGFESLASFCSYIDGPGFRICKIDENYVLLPILKPWRLSEAETDLPNPLEVQEVLEYPKDVADFHYVLRELNPKDYVKEGEVINIVITNYEDPLKFYFLPEPFFSTFAQFRKGLTDFYRYNRELVMPREFIRPGQLCAVGYLIRRFMCVYDRGIIVDIYDESTVSVLLIDTGRTILAPMNVVKFLHKQFASFPVHSFPGLLAGLIPRRAKLSETANTKMLMLFVEPSVEAEIYTADFNVPMVTIILYSRYSRISLNQQLIDSGDYSLSTLFPAKRFRRYLDEVESNPEGDESEIPGKVDSEPLINLSFEGETDVDDPDSKEIERPHLPNRGQRDPWAPLPEARLRIRPSPSIIRPRPIVHANKSSLALGPVSAPPNMESDARQSDSKSSNSKDLKPIHLPLQAQALALKPNENEIVETGLMSRPIAQSVLLQFKFMIFFPPNPTPLRRKCLLPAMLQNEITPSGTIKVRLPVIPSENSSPDSDEFEDPSPLVEAKILKKASSATKGKKGRDTKVKPIIHPEENNLNVDRDEMFPPERSTFFDVPKAKINVSSDSTESDAEPEIYTKHDTEKLTDDLEELHEEMELIRLTISLLATNQIVQDVARRWPERAYSMAKEWAKVALETNDSSLPDGEFFNPFDKLRETEDEELAFKYHLLALMIPGFIYDEYLALANVAPMGYPSIYINSRSDCQSLLLPKNTSHYAEKEEAQKTLDICENFEPTWEKITIEVTPSVNKRRYRLVSFNMNIFVSRDQLKLLRAFPQLEIEKRLKHCQRIVINWPINTPNDSVKFQEFLRFFKGFITLHKYVEHFEMEVKEKLISPGATR